jgi:hypothetical protein
MAYSRTYKIAVRVTSENEVVDDHVFVVRRGTDELTQSRLARIGSRLVAKLAAADAAAVDPREEDL